MKSFPSDMASREGYEIIEEKFEKGDLAPTTVLFESENEITEEMQANLIKQLSKQNLVSSVRASGISEDGLAAQFQLTLIEELLLQQMNGDFLIKLWMFHKHEKTLGKMHCMTQEHLIRY